MTQSTPPTLPEPPSGARESDALEIARLTGELFHDLNDGLLTLAALADFAGAEAAEGRSTTESISQLREVCRQLREGVRDVSEAMHGRKTPPDVDFDPWTVARTAYDHWLITTPALDTSIKCVVPVGTRVRGQASFLYRSVTNLLRNAGRHARREVQMRIRSVDSPNGPGVELTVEDDGSGVPPELKDRVFEPYVRAAPGGTGLGLSVVNWAVRQLGGSVRLIDGGSLGGARFTIFLPVVINTRPAQPLVIPPAGGLKGSRVAVVDDNPAIRRMLAKLLSREGAIALEFVPGDYGGADALAVGLAAANVDLVLLDVEMGPFNGLTVWRALQQRDATAGDRVLFLSGYVYDTVQAVPVLADRWVTKEGTWDLIRQAIVDHLARTHSNRDG